MDLEGRDAVYTYPDSTRNKNYYLNMGGNHFVNNNLSIQGNMYYRHMERRNYNGDEFEGGDCGLGYLTDRGAADGILCAELEVSGGSDEQVLDVAGNAISYTALGLERDDDENEVEDFGAINRSNTKTKPDGI